MFDASSIRPALPSILTPRSFGMDRQIARLDRLGIDRTILSLATPFIDYHLDAKNRDRSRTPLINDALVAFNRGG